MARGPFPFIIFPDPALQGVSQVSSVTSERGRYIGPAAPQAANAGDLVPFMEGSPDVDKDYDLRLYRAGGLDGTAEWGWKYNDEASTEWRGVDDIRKIKCPQDLFESNPTGNWLVLFFSESNQRRIVMGHTTGTTFTIYYQDVGDGDRSWSSTTFTPSRGTANVDASGYTLPDGVLRLLVPVEITASSDYDWDQYESTDGGLTWTRISRDIVQSTTGSGTGFQPGRMVVASSGDYVRIVYNDGVNYRSLVSSDRGASWKTVVNLTSGAAASIYDLCPVNDSAGSFLLFIDEGTNITARSASRRSDWTATSWSPISTSGTDTTALAACADTSNCYLLVFNSAASDDRYLMLYQRPRHEALDGSWYNTLEFPGFNANAAQDLEDMRMSSGGDRLMVLGYVGSTGDSAYFSLLGWTKRSFVFNPYTALIASGALYSNLWMSLFGYPTESANTQFTKTSSGTTETWNAKYTEYADAAPSTDRWYNEYSEGGTPTDKWADDSVHTWIVQPVSGGGSNSRALAVQVAALGSAAGITTAWSVRYDSSPASFVVYDEAASTALLTVAGLDFSEFYEFRAAQTLDGGNYFLDVAYRSVAGETWASTGALTLSSAGTATAQFQRFGHIVTGVASRMSRWVEMGVKGSDDYRQHEFTNPDDLRGRICDSSPAPLNDGVYARWGGGGGFEADQFLAEMMYSNPIEAIFTPSPRMKWRSNAGVTQTLVLDADSTNNLKLFEHDGLALIGLNVPQVRVQYNATDAWVSPSVDATINGVLYGSLTIDQINSGALRFSGQTTRDGELHNKYVQITSGSQNGKMMKVTKHVGDRIFFGDETAPIGASASDTFQVFDDKIVHSFPTRHAYQFMRLIFPYDSDTAEGDVRLGCLVAGITYDFTTALDWVHSDSAAPNVQLETGLNGMRWGWKWSDARRRLEARIVGDVDMDRWKLRDLMGMLSDYSAKPVVYVNDGAQKLRSAIYGRITSGGDLENAGYVQTGGVWTPVGDMTLILEEEL